MAGSGENQPMHDAIEVSMKNYRKELWFNVPTRRAFINITEEVQQCIDDSGIREGLVLVKAK